MTWHSAGFRLLPLAASLLAFVPTSEATAEQPCPSTATTSRETAVHPGPPRFVTGRGWLIEAAVDTLARNIEVRVCERRRIGVIPSTRLWLHVQYGRSKEGWIPADAVQERSAALATAAMVPRLGFVAVREQENVQEPRLVPYDNGPDPQWTYAWMLLAVMLGMVAKSVFDRLECDHFSVKDCLRQTVRAIVVAPIVFLGIGKLGTFDLDSGLSSASMLLYMGWAFQNGFFWQTVLGRASSSATVTGAENGTSALERVAAPVA